MLFTSMLDRMEKEQVFSVGKHKTHSFVIQEECDQYFRQELTPDELRQLGQELIALADEAQQTADAQVQRTAVRVMTKALDELTSACTDEAGAPKAPDKKALMKARAMLPAWCENSMTKPTAKQA